MCSAVWDGRSALFWQVLVGAVIIGGIGSIAAVTARLVPLMAVLYLGGTLAVIAMHASAIPAAVGAIIEGAFTGSGVAGGAIGAAVIGMQRAVFSNEAGIGSASIAHAAVKTKLPATEGHVALFGPFLDTVVICTLTALTIGVATETWPDFMSSGAEGVAMTSDAFGRTVSWFPIPLAFIAVLFAVSTMISWAYYGMKGWAYLFGEARQHATDLQRYLLCLCRGLAPPIQLESVLNFSDAMVFVLCVPNVLGLVILAPVVREELAALRRRRGGAEARCAACGRCMTSTVWWGHDAAEAGCSTSGLVPARMLCFHSNAAPQRCSSAEA